MENRCSVCSRQFSDAQVSGSTMFLDWIKQKGFRCSKCGKRYCEMCIPKKSDGTLHCLCGNTTL